MMRQPTPLLAEQSPIALVSLQSFVMLAAAMASLFQHPWPALEAGAA
ncbi:hypothetical protein KNJ79_11890 [Sphingopyxis indica]|nr:hypothetical protein [Sphingopyxis indica]WOF41937.1 hypothetical protein KNJ79_11890 [Sphingopyxis indica]